MISVSKALMNELRREFVDHDIDTWLNKSVPTIRAWMILIDNMDINVANVVVLIVLMIKVRHW